MNKVTFKGNPVDLKGNVPSNNTKAPDFTYVKDDLSEMKFSDNMDDVKVIIAVPSIDTGVCQEEARRFNEKLEKKEGVKGIVISKDLPFALSRFCAAEGIKNVEVASDFRGDFTENYNLTMTNGPLQGLSARAVFVVDKDNNIQYSELVPEIGQEPDYDKVIEKVDELLK